MRGVNMAITNWPQHYLLLEHGLSALSAFDLHAFKTNPESFEATEFPLLLEDMKTALGALEQTCQHIERTHPKAYTPTTCLPVTGSAYHG